MRPTSFAGKAFSDLRVSAGFRAYGIAGPARSPIAVEREGQAPIAVGMRQGVRTLPINFTVDEGEDVEEVSMALIGAMQAAGRTPGVLTAVVMGDGVDAGTEIECLAQVGQYRRPNPNSVEIDFSIADDRWFARSATDYPLLTVGNGAVIPLDNRGKAAVQPVLIGGWATQRAGSSASVGWKYIKQETITNSGTRAWRRVRKTVDLGDHAALVTAGKSQADGDDLRVRVHGTPSWMEIPRTLTNPNTKRCFVHFYVTIPAGQSRTYDFCYGNSAATAPDTLSVRTENADIYAADDLEGTSGTATSGGAATLTNSGATWETNRWRYGYIQIVAGTGTGQRRKIASNTATAITVTRNWSTQPTSSSVYVVWMTGVNVDGGLVTTNGTTTSLTDANQAWGTNEWKGGYVYNITQAIGPFRITSNTATVLTTATMSNAPASSDSYYIEKYGVIQYMVNRGVTESAHRGLWRLNQYHQAGGRVWYGDQTPGGWIPRLMLPNNDDLALGRYVDEGSAGGHAINNWPGLYARRGVRSDNTWPEKGQHDGATLYDPRAFLGLDWDYQMKNEGGIGQVVLMTQQPNGDTWQTAGTDSATRSTLANVTAGSGIAGYTNLTGDETPVLLYLGVLPANGVEIPSTAKKSRSVELRNHAKMIVHLDVTDCGGMTNGIYVVGSEIAVYDHQASFRIGGGDDAVPPYDVVTSNVLLAADRDLRINPNLESGLPLIGIYTASTGALVERAPMAATITHHELNLDGDDVGTETKILTALPPSDNLVPHPDDIVGWTINDGGAGVAATLHDETSTYFGPDAQAIRINVTSAPVGAWSFSLEQAAIAVIPGALYEFGAIVRCSITGLDISITAEWQEDEPGGATSAVDGTDSQTVTIASASRWYPIGGGRKVHAGSAITSPTGGVNLYLLIEGTGTVSGNIYIDPVTLGSNGPTNVYLTEPEPGELTFGLTYTKAFYG